MSKRTIRREDIFSMSNPKEKDRKWAGNRQISLNCIFCWLEWDICVRYKLVDGGYKPSRQAVTVQLQSPGSVLLHSKILLGNICEKVEICWRFVKQ